MTPLALESLESSSQTSGSPEQPGASAGMDLSDTYRLEARVPGAVPENAVSGEVRGALSPSSPPGDLDPSVPLPTIARIPDLPPSPYRFELLQQWEGTVGDMRGDEFDATIADLTEPSRPEEHATFPLEEVSEGDLKLVGPGAVFRWSIGYRTRNGQKERVSNISFLRLPAWSRGTMEAVERTTAELEEMFPLPESP